MAKDSPERDLTLLQRPTQPRIQQKDRRCDRLIKFVGMQLTFVPAALLAFSAVAVTQSSRPAAASMPRMPSPTMPNLIPAIFPASGILLPSCSRKAR